jgi:dimethylamine monooxygenase subunit C
MPGITYKILSVGSVVADFYYINAEVTDGSSDLTTGTVRDISINGMPFHVPATLVRLPVGLQGHFKFYFDLSACEVHERNHFINALDGVLKVEELSELIAIKSNKHKYMLFMDRSGLLCSLPIILALGYLGMNVEVYFEKDTTNKSTKMIETYLKSITAQIKSVRVWDVKALEYLLSEQKVGTELLYMCNWPKLTKLVKLAQSVGFTQDEIQSCGTGERQAKVFCVKCYRLIERPAQNKITCEHCGISLAVSNHYSHRLEAFLGYVDQV